MPNYGNKQLTDQNHTKFVITQSNEQTNKNDTCPSQLYCLTKVLSLSTKLFIPQLRLENFPLFSKRPDINIEMNIQKCISIIPNRYLLRWPALFVI